MDTADEARLIDEQLAYYRARAPEFEEWWDGQGTGRSPSFHDEVRRLESVVDGLGRVGSVLELACGTGIWTRRLARQADHIVAVDGAAETLALNASRLPADACPVSFIEADLFDWEPKEPADLVFFALWLSHVPERRFDEFWDLVDRALVPGGRFFCIDNRSSYWVNQDPNAGGQIDAELGTRRLNDGREFRIVKRCYEPDELTARLAGHGWSVEANATGPEFLYAEGTRTRPAP